MELINYDKPNLPVALDDLAKFVLVGREKLTMVRAGIRAMDKLDMAEGVRKQKKEEAQMLAEALLDAEVRIGEILAGMPKASGGDRKSESAKIKIDTGVDFDTTPTKQEAIKELGFDQKQAERFQTLAANTDLVEQVKEEARKSEDLPTRAAVLKAAKVRAIETRREKIINELEKQDFKPGDKKYRIIYADPPWKYGNAMPDYVTEPQDYYLLMDTSDICKMPVKDVLEDDAVLFLWSTSPHLPEALEVAKSWGFTYKTSFIWDKVKHNMGHYNSVRHELLLVCTRGACTPDVKKLFDSVVSIERTEHSKKPAFFREVIETLYTYGNKLELFAREAPEGWDVFGNQS
jgi:N6-adenosine-specific RNA methylase IME4